MLKKNIHEHWTRVTRSNPLWVSDTSKQVWSSLVPRVFSLCNMAAAGEKTLAHSRNHVTDSSTDSGNFFKIAAKIKSERIWVRGLETGEKQTKWRQKQTRKKLKICKNALKGYRNTAEWYILFSVPWPSFVLSLHVLAYTALYNCLQLNLSTPASFHCILFFAYSECQRFSFLLSWKGEPFLTVSAIYFMLGISRTDLWRQGIFCHDPQNSALRIPPENLLIPRQKLL